MNKTLIFVLFGTYFALLVSAQAQVAGHPHTKVFAVGEGREITLDQIVDRLIGANVVFFGEEHNDSIAHALQYQVYKALIQRLGRVTLSMEMFERDAQLVVDEYLQGHITEAKLQEEGKAWGNYSDYAPLVDLAMESGQQVIAANVPTRYANLVARRGLAALEALPRASRPWMAKLPIDTQRPVYQRKFDEAMGGHGHGMGPSVFHAQLLRDATMAESIWRTWKKDRRTPIFHLNGRFHSDYYLGTVEELRRLNNRIEVVTISCFSSDDFENPDWAPYGELADLIILTDPAVLD